MAKTRRQTAVNILRMFLTNRANGELKTNRFLIPLEIYSYRLRFLAVPLQLSVQLNDFVEADLLGGFIFETLFD